MSAADFVDNTDFFMHNLLEPKNKPGPFFMEFWQYLNVCIFYEMDYDCCVQDTFKSWDPAIWNRTVLGIPKSSSDPRFFSVVALFIQMTILFRRMNCAERTVRKKIGKMTYLHIYFDSYGVTKFTKSQRFGWQVGDQPLAASILGSSNSVRYINWTDNQYIDTLKNHVI